MKRALPPVPAGVQVLGNAHLQAWVLPYGARLMQLWWLQAPEGVRPLTLGFADPADYRHDGMSMGAVCGRYANRIADAVLEHQGRCWLLDVNHPLGHCIHGGRAGMGETDWSVTAATEESVLLELDLPDGHMGFPGRCRAQVSYRLEGMALCWSAQAELDAPCPLNLVQHSYWNLDATPDVSRHRLQVAASQYLPLDARELPCAPVPVDGGRFDFRVSRHPEAATLDRLDGALCLDPHTPDQVVATLQVPDLSLQIHTDRPYLHLYAAAGLRPTAAPLGVVHGPGTALCLESEDLPNGPALGAPVWYGPDRPYTHRVRWALTALAQSG